MKQYLRSLSLLVCNTIATILCQQLRWSSSKMANPSILWLLKISPASHVLILQKKIKRKLSPSANCGDKAVAEGDREGS